MYVTRHHAIDASGTETVVRELRDRLEVIDALYRFALGSDLQDRDLFLSAFTVDGEFDFRPAAAKCGLDIPLMSGRDTIADIILNPDIPLDTTHVVTNVRVEVADDHARLTAHVEAQHLPKGDHTRHALLKNLYDVDLVRDGRRWLMRRACIDNVWFTGDPKVIIGL
ncbi:nuclear transport factor 2 family protein [Streptomyces sp. NPDC085932]|uniref:nuclear transport factor 2 family protein n=1 Tax=Streptomyces sp. NPDC085932 TaxID=3365741 RepID=UPI0037D8E859